MVKHVLVDVEMHVLEDVVIHVLVVVLVHVQEDVQVLVPMLVLQVVLQDVEDVDHLVQEDAVDHVLVDVIRVLDALEDALLHVDPVVPTDVEDVQEDVPEIVLDRADLIVLMDAEDLVLHHVVIHAVLDVKVV